MLIAALQKRDKYIYLYAAIYSAFAKCLFGYKQSQTCLSLCCCLETRGFLIGRPLSSSAGDLIWSERDVAL